MFLICISYGISIQLCSPVPEYDTSQVQAAVEEYKQKYWNLNTTEEPRDREVLEEDKDISQEQEDGV